VIHTAHRAFLGGEIEELTMCWIRRERRNAYKILARKRLGKREPGRPRKTWEQSIKRNLRETGCEGRR
jgi:hypothetical protein